MPANGLTATEEAIFDYYMSIEDGLNGDYPFLYHYRSGSTVTNHIFTENNIQLRLTRADCFEDKLEGIVVDVYYDLALEELILERKISKTQYAVLSEVRLPTEELFVRNREDGVHLGTMERYEAYVICFSSIKNDPYMFKSYGSFCLAIMKSELQWLESQAYGNGIRVKTTSVYYGKKAVDFLKKKILEIVSNEFLFNNAKMIMSDNLHEFQYRAKCFQYHKENEIRMIVYIPENGNISSKYFEKYSENEKYYLRLCLPKHGICEITHAPDHISEAKEIMAVLQKRGYDYDL